MELRDLVWQFSLVEEDYVTITPDLQQPALLRVCRSVRQEAAKVWYSMNTFFIQVRDCDDTLLSAFTKYSQSMKVKIDVKGEIKGNENWSNLLIWCRRLYDGESRYLVTEEMQGRQACVISAAHDIILQQLELDSDWDECEQASENLHSVVRRWIEAWK